MKKRYLVIAVGVWLAACTASWARDQIKTSQKTFPGRVLRMNPLEVTIEYMQIEKRIPVNEIVSISYDEEPAQLKGARSSINEGRYLDALTALEKVKTDNTTRREILQDVEFYKALCAARAALGGSGTIQDAGRKMIMFERAHPGSYHYLEACEVVGDLLVAMGRYPQAEDYYARLAKAPWADYKMRAGVLLGRALAAQPGKAAQALAAFEGVLKSTATGKLADTQRMAATLGKARCLTATGKQQVALQMIKKVIVDADPEQIGLHARAYNALGTALRKAGKDKDALMAFLHVDVLYNRLPEAHAEALYNLAQLWQKLNKMDRARRARGLLKTRYANTPWAKREG